MIPFPTFFGYDIVLAAEDGLISREELDHAINDVMVEIRRAFPCPLLESPGDMQRRLLIDNLLLGLASMAHELVQWG